MIKISEPLRRATMRADVIYSAVMRSLLTEKQITGKTKKLLKKHRDFLKTLSPELKDESHRVGKQLRRMIRTREDELIKLHAGLRLIQSICNHEDNGKEMCSHCGLDLSK